MSKRPLLMQGGFESQDPSQENAVQEATELYLKKLGVAEPPGIRQAAQNLLSGARTTSLLDRAGRTRTPGGEHDFGRAIPAETSVLCVCGFPKAAHRDAPVEGGACGDFFEQRRNVFDKEDSSG